MSPFSAQLLPFFYPFVFRQLTCHINILNNTELTKSGRNLRRAWKRARSLAQNTVVMVTPASSFLSVKRKTPLFSFLAFIEYTEALRAS